VLLLNNSIVDIESWNDLKDYCKLGLLSSTIKQIAEEKGKEAKIKPDAHLLLLILETEAKKFLGL
jgi:hypothetical protein